MTINGTDRAGPAVVGHPTGRTYNDMDFMQSDEEDAATKSATDDLDAVIERGVTENVASSPMRPAASDQIKDEWVSEDEEAAKPARGERPAPKAFSFDVLSSPPNRKMAYPPTSSQRASQESKRRRRRNSDEDDYRPDTSRRKTRSDDEEEDEAEMADFIVDDDYDSEEERRQAERRERKAKEAKRQASVNAGSTKISIPGRPAPATVTTAPSAKVKALDRFKFGGAVLGELDASSSSEDEKELASEHVSPGVVPIGKRKRVVLDDEDEDVAFEEEGRYPTTTTRRTADPLANLRRVFPHVEDGSLLDALTQSRGNLDEATALILEQMEVDAQPSSEQRQWRKRQRDLKKAEEAKRKNMEVVDDEEEEEEDAMEVDEVEAGPPPDILVFFNTVDAATISDMTNATAEEAALVLRLRPFLAESHLQTQLASVKLSRLMTRYEKCRDGYLTVAWAVRRVEELSANFIEAMRDPHCWQPGPRLSPSRMLPDFRLPVTASMAALNEKIAIKGYQLHGVSWLLSLYSYGHSAILADEMGLGKTAQVVTFLGLLTKYRKENEAGTKRRLHIVVVPSSTLTNWSREFARFAPDVQIYSYHGSQAERVHQRAEIKEDRDALDVIITTYNLTTGAKEDRAFLRKLDADCLILDEGHMVKNMESSRFQGLISIPCQFRLLMTGTPVQNNLLELFSLLTFIMPKIFLARLKDCEGILATLSNVDDPRASLIESLKPLFAMAQNDSSFLSNQRIRNAQAILAPFILRRKKSDVVNDLPPKRQEVVHCSMTPTQEAGYKAERRRGRAELKEIAAQSLEKKTEAAPKKAKRLTGLAKELAELNEASSLAGKEEEVAPKKLTLKLNATAKAHKTKSHQLQNIAMQLRKWADHPLLQRQAYDDSQLTIMSKKILGDPDYSECSPEIVFEDMQCMSDFQLHALCKKSKPLHKFMLDEHAALAQGGKVSTLIQLIQAAHQRDEKVLVFTQFTMMLDILEAVMNMHQVKYLRMDGSSAVGQRQSLIDEFQSDEEGAPFVFLLSTRAGGFGINLTRASVVILYDQDFNPHNDAQAEDRAHRVGQSRDVVVHRLVTRHTIEEQMYACAQRKLELDQKMQQMGDTARTSIAIDAEEGEGKKKRGSKKAEETQSAEVIEDVDEDMLADVMQAELDDEDTAAT